MAKARRSRTSNGNGDRPPVLELVSGAAGLLLVLGVLGIIVWHGLTVADAPAEIQLSVEDVRPGSGGISVQIRALNAGGRTAAEVEVEGRLGEATAATLFDFIPAGAERRGTLVFPPADGGGQQPELRVLSYREP